MEIRIEHAARGKTFDHAQLLDSEQNQSRPDVIQKLDSDKQDPKRNLVLLAPYRKSDTIMSNKHPLFYIPYGAYRPIALWKGE
jgi:hypothetical protein